MEPVSETTEAAASKLRNLLAPLEMKQFYPLHPNVPNKGCSLDLLFSNLAVEEFEVLDRLVHCDEHHIPSVFTLEAGVKDSINFDRIVYNFKRANVQGIVETLSMLLIGLNL